jgi:hypothetical protein
MAITDTAPMIIQLATAPAADWVSANPKLPMGMLGHESDTKKVKMGDGVKTWNQLGYMLDQRILKQYTDLLDAANQANGVAVLNNDGIIPLEILPPEALTHIKFVANLEARDNLPLIDRKCLVIVLDASGDIVAIEDAMQHTFDNVYSTVEGEVNNGGAVIIDFGTMLGITPEDFEGTQKGDITVKVSGAVYTWNGTTLDNGVWLKLSEFESMDIDFNIYFNTVLETLESINDGTNYIKFTLLERNKLEIVMRNDVTQLIRGLTPVALKTATEVA